MAVFNSLGSNYNFKFAIKALFARNRNGSVKLKDYLEKKYQGQAILLYKGREALQLSIETLKLEKDSYVAITGYTCFAVYDAVEKAGLKSYFLDIDDKLNFSAETLKIAINNNPKIKALVVQNTLGFPCDIERIQKICRDNSVILIEDLAHSIGSFYENKKEAGTTGNFSALSFSQDKVIDTVSGGALIIRDKKYFQKNIDLNPLSKKQQLQDRFYPLLTFLIRFFYKIELGKIFHFLFKKLNLLSKPMSLPNSNRFMKLPDWQANLVFENFKNLEKNLTHRKKITKIYLNNLNDKLKIYNNDKILANSTIIRFPVIVEKRSSLLQFLKNQGIYLSDIWYDAPVAPSSYFSLTAYQGECPKAEEISSKMLNLPTHFNVSEACAKTIADKINQWIK